MDKGEATQLISAVRQQTVPTVTAAIITARGKPTSIGEILEVQQSVTFALNPMPGHGAWEAWNKNKADHLGKVYD